MTVKIEKGILTIQIPVEDPIQPSTSGKTLLVATTHGSKTSTLKYNEEALVISLNAYIPNRAYVKVP